MAMEGVPYLVQAIYSFKGKNNDELCFRKGDIITVTQMEDGGWWEGTLDGKTGWFPANYVQEYKQPPCPTQGDCLLASGKGSGSPISPASPMQGVAAQRAYRHVVLSDMVESERVHVGELKTLLSAYLQPLQKAQLLNNEEYSHLVGNLPAVLEAHEQLVRGLEAELRVEERQEGGGSSTHSRVGRLFLSSAPLLKTVHSNYCAGHPRAVCLLEKYRDELGAYMENRGATPPGLLVLTTGLSRPFRRLDKYAGMLQELERHLGDGHPDSGDTQRSVSIYGEVASGCCALRRQKELELEVLRGGVRGWEGEDLHTLGEILHMGSVAVGPDHRDRHLLLFPSTLLILSASQRMSAFIYEGKLPLSGISVTKLEDTDVCKNAFEISGPMIERIVAQCQSKEDQGRWVSLLNHHINVIRKTSSTSGSGVPSPSVASSLTTSPPPPPLPSTTSPTSSTKSQKISPITAGMPNSTQAAKHVSPTRPPLPPRPFPPPKNRKFPDATKPPRPPLPPKPSLSVTLASLRSSPNVPLRLGHRSDPQLPSARSHSEASDVRSNSPISLCSSPEVTSSKTIPECLGSSYVSQNRNTDISVCTDSSVDALSSSDDQTKSKYNIVGDTQSLRDPSFASATPSTSSREPSSELPSLLNFPDTSSNTSSVIAPIDDPDFSAQETEILPEAIGDARGPLVQPHICVNHRGSQVMAMGIPREISPVLESKYRPPRPYSQLAAHFADLLQRHVITSDMLKHLLYKEYGTVIEVDSVALRVRPSEIPVAVETEEEDKVGCGTAGRKIFLPRQDAVDCDKDAEDSDRSVYSGDEFVRYFDGSDVEEVYLESGTGDESEVDEESFVDIEVEEEVDGWRNVATQTDPSLFSNVLEDLEEEEYEDEEESMFHREIFAGSDADVKDENCSEDVCRDSCGTDSDGWTYQDYRAGESNVPNAEATPVFGSAGLCSPLLDLREAGISGVKEMSYTVGKRFATGRRRKGLEEEKRHSVPTSLLPCLSRDPVTGNCRENLDYRAQTLREDVAELKDMEGDGKVLTCLCSGAMENIARNDRIEGSGEEKRIKDLVKKSAFKEKKKGKRGKKSLQDKGVKDGRMLSIDDLPESRVSPIKEECLRRKETSRRKELKDEWVTVESNDPFLESGCLGAMSSFCVSQSGIALGDERDRFRHLDGNPSMQESSSEGNGSLGNKKGANVESVGQGMDCGSTCVVGIHAAGCRLASAEGVRDAPCPCQWVDFPSRRSSDSGLADVCCAGAQVEGDRRKKERQKTPPSQKGDDGCHDCEERTVSVSTSPVSPLVSPLPAEDGVGSEGEAAPWWERVRLTAQALGVSAEALKLSAEALKVSAEAMGFLGDQGAAAGRRLAGVDTSGSGRSGAPSPAGPSPPSSS